MARLVCPPPSKEYSKFHSGVEDDTAEGNLNLTHFSTSTFKVQQPLFFLLLFNQQLSSSVPGEGGDRDWDTIATPIFPSSSSMDIWQRKNSPGFWPLWPTLWAQHIKIYDKESNILFSIVSSLNAFFSGSFNSNFSTSEEREKSHKILANANLKQKGKK